MFIIFVHRYVSRVLCPFLEGLIEYFAVSEMSLIGPLTCILKGAAQISQLLVATLVLSHLYSETYLRRVTEVAVHDM